MADLFAPVITAVYILPNPAAAGETILIEVEATDAATLYTPDGRKLKLTDGKILTVGRESMAIEYESAYTGAQHDAAVQAVTEKAARWDEAVAALDGLAALLAAVVGVPANG